MYTQFLSMYYQVSTTTYSLMQTKGCYDMSSDPFSQKFPRDAASEKALERTQLCSVKIQFVENLVSIFTSAIKNLTVFYTMCWVTGTNDSSTKRLMFQALFFPIISFKILCKNCFHFFSYFSFYNFTKIKVKSFESPKSIRNYERKIMLGTSDAWLMSRLSNRTSEPAYHIED